jgi:hypothetical protein
VRRGLFALAAAAALAACTSPEAERVRGGGPGADVGNRGAPVVMHEGSRPYAGTPTLIPVESPQVESATQARELSRAQ